jgi:flavin reductase (DIM6/NTAB) family NADH-FMN oxidoreductase RutF
MGLLEGKPKDSLAHIRANGQFAINLVPFELAEAMNITAVPFASGINELEKAGLRTLPCKYINGVRIEASPVCIECELADIVNVKPSSVIVMGHVRAVHIADEAITNPERLHIDASKLRLIGRMESPGWYTHTSQRFHMQQLNVAQWEQQSGK